MKLAGVFAADKKLLQTFLCSSPVIASSFNFLSAANISADQWDVMLSSGCCSDAAAGRCDVIRRRSTWTSSASSASSALQEQPVEAALSVCGQVDAAPPKLRLSISSQHAPPSSNLIYQSAGLITPSDLLHWAKWLLSSARVAQIKAPARRCCRAPACRGAAAGAAQINQSSLRRELLVIKEKINEDANVVSLQLMKESKWRFKFHTHKKETAPEAPNTQCLLEPVDQQGPSLRSRVE